LTLIDNANKTLKALRVTNQYHPAGNPEILALQTQLQQQNKLTTKVFDTITATLSNLNKSNSKHGEQGNGRSGGNQRTPKPAWFNEPPTDLDQIRQHDNREWHWCPKCGHSQGKWVCTHLPAEHNESYVPKKRKPTQDNTGNRPTRARSPPTTANDAHAFANQAELAKIITQQVTVQLQAYFAHNTATPAPNTLPPPTPSATDVDMEDDWVNYTFPPYVVYFKLPSTQLTT